MPRTVMVLESVVVAVERLDMALRALMVVYRCQKDLLRILAMPSICIDAGGGGDGGGAAAAVVVVVDALQIDADFHFQKYVYLLNASTILSDQDVAMHCVSHMVNAVVTFLAIDQQLQQPPLYHQMHDLESVLQIVQIVEVLFAKNGSPGPFELYFGWVVCAAYVPAVFAVSSTGSDLSAVKHFVVAADVLTVHQSFATTMVTVLMVAINDFDVAAFHHHSCHSSNFLLLLAFALRVNYDFR